ncbi:MAG TPA: hypothetical protein VN934_09025 [Candidatus Tumulicola sp.]|nr:hypothetical protein [Candidatus Tumulicola sp.]
MKAVSGPPLSALERRRLLVMRAWRPNERLVVARGFSGRFVTALEPAVIAILFAAFTFGLDNVRRHAAADLNGYQYFVALFGLGAAVFTLYAIALVLAPLRALLETRKPIFIVDGYLRTRGRDDWSDRDTSGYIAVMLDDGRVACEWPVHGDTELVYAVHPAYMEFSEFGGIHKVDGQGTGVLSDEMPPFGVGINHPLWRKRS